MDIPDLSEPTCPDCEDASFDNFRSFSAHNAALHGGNALVTLVGADTLVQLYRTRSEHKMADLLGVNQVTVHKALETLDVDTSNPQHSENPNLITSQGYERLTHRDHQVLHHRLLAVAEYGFDTLRENVVHHGGDERFHPRGVELPWANWRENLKLMTRSDHIKEHEIPQMNDYDTRPGAK